MYYVDLKKKVVLYTAKKKGDGKLDKGRPFMYGCILRLHYEDSNSLNLIVMVDCSKGVRKMVLLENCLVKESCGPESFKLALETSQNLITTLRPYIQGHNTLRDASPSLVKAPKNVSVQSRSGKEKMTKMLESELSSSTEDEETRAMRGAELAFGVLLSE